VVAEGVEDEAQAIILRAAGCDRMQGYWFARPMVADAMEERLRGERQAHRPALAGLARRMAAR
jgi:EAL domain-containing protein (putative c-di-GMP-specific phosphodiesterase class I)